MARFNFRLQPLLSVKEQIEEQKEIEYGQALQRLDEERRRKQMLLDWKEEHIRLFREALEIRIDPADSRRFNNFIEKLKQRIIEQDKRIEAAEAYAEKKRLELVEAMKERKMLESVREHRLEDFNTEEKIAEQKIVDEIVSYKYSEQMKLEVVNG
jgi:flagellar FliJ protein